MEFLKGNEVFKEAVRHITQTRKVPHAVLITGEDGSGKKTAARYLCASILCEGKEKPCFSCPNCRKITENIHPDVIELSPSDSGIYKIDAIRELRVEAAVKPNQSEHKFYIIEKADGMNKNAANSLLKCMEEPPEGVVFILLSDDESKLLPTVLSRAIRFRTTPVSLGCFEAEFASDAKRLFELSGGNLGKARILAKGSDEKSFAELFMESSVKGGTYEVLRLIKRSYMKRYELEEILGSVTVILKNALVAKEIPSRGSEIEKEIAAALSSDKIFEVITETDRLRDLLVRNISGESILTSLYLKIKA